MAARIEFRSRAEIADESWNCFVDGSDEAWLWHRTEFIDARSKWEGCRDASFCVCDAQGRIVAVVPMLVTTIRHFRGIIPVKRLYSEGGPALLTLLSQKQRERLQSALTEFLLDQIDQHEAEDIEARIPALAPYVNGPLARRVNPLVHFGFESTAWATWMISLDGTPEMIRRRYSETTRQLLKKANETTYSVREAAGNADLDTYYSLHLQTIRRLRSAPLPFEYFRRIFEVFQPRGFARIVFFERNGYAVAAHNTATYKSGAYYWTGESVTERNDYESRVLFDEQIMAAKAQGRLYFEAGKAYINGDNASVVLGSSNFKKSFGPEMVTFHGGRVQSRAKKFGLIRRAHKVLLALR